MKKISKNSKLSFIPVIQYLGGKGRDKNLPWKQQRKWADQCCIKFLYPLVKVNGDNLSQFCHCFWTHGSGIGTQNVSEARVWDARKLFHFFNPNPQTNLTHSLNACCIIGSDNINKKSSNTPFIGVNFRVLSSRAISPSDFE